VARQPGVVKPPPAFTPSSRPPDHPRRLFAGYVTADDNYTWICQPCFEDFKASF
jgi:hypothetical protein